MSDAVNLNRFRKRKKAAAKESAAAANRAKFGRTKGEKARDRNEREALARHVDGHEIETEIPRNK